jgi:hypothetical protein
MTRFAKVPKAATDNSFTLGISEDQRALTLTFSDFASKAEAGKQATAPVASRIFSIVLPLEDPTPHVEVEFILDAGMVISEAATASLVLSVNGQTAAADFRAPTDESFIHRMTFAADGASECRLTVALIVGRDSNSADSAALLSVLSMDAEVLPRPE